MKRLDAFLDSITIYRLLLYYLIGLLIVAVVLSTLGILPYQPFAIAFSAVYLCTICWIANKAFAWAFQAPTNVESPYITALILALIVSPSPTPNGVLFLTIAGVIAMASKYALAVRLRHIFNPAGIAVLLTSFAIGQAASWWVGTPSMLPFVLIGGFLLVRRTRRTEMTMWFFGAALGASLLYGVLFGAEPIATTQGLVTSSALLFFAAVMLTEPLTSPTTRVQRLWYAVIVGVLFPPQLVLVGLPATPELALAIGNVFTYVTGSRTKTFLRLKNKKPLSHDSTDFSFTPVRPFQYMPGQYMEFTFQHPHTDARGARRYFTLASSPTEKDVHIGIKFYNPSSSFKRELQAITPESRIIAGQLGGDFTLPQDTQQKLVFIAGGIGITPFRSMLKYLSDTNQKRDITLLYAVRTPADIVYRDIIDEATTKVGARAVFIAGEGQPTQSVRIGRLTADLIREVVPDYTERLFYISGPHGMVVAATDTLNDMHVPKRQIKKDFFSGYA